MKKLLSLFLVLALAFSLCVGVLAEEPAAEPSDETAGELAGQIVILHTNDVHGAIDGYAKVAAIKSDYEAKGAEVLLFDAGDFIQGTTSVSLSQGATAVELMNLAGYDLVTLGNHEVDYGLAHLLLLEKCADFPIINANLHIKSNGRRMFRPFWIAHIDGMKILFIGIITEEVLAATKTDELIGSFVDIGEAAREVGNICNAYNAIDFDFTVLLTQIGFEED